MRLNTALAPQNSGNWCKHHPAVPMAALPWCFSLGSVEALSPLRNPANLSYGENEECRKVQNSPVMTCPVESFSLEKLFQHREEQGEFKQRQHNAILLLQTCPWLSSSPSHVAQFAWKNTPCGVGGRGWHIWEGCTIPFRDFSLGSSVLEFWMRGGKERSWEGKKGNRAWEQTGTRVKNLVG